MILDPDRLPILETERLRLAPLAVDDAALLFPIMGDPEVMAYWDMAEIDDPDLVELIIARQVEGMGQGRWRCTGRCAPWPTAGSWAPGGPLRHRRLGNRRAEVGFILGREAWGHGYAREALQLAVIGFAGANGVRKLAARTHLGNRRSEALLEKLGFTEEGLLRGHILRDGERRDCRLFGLLL